MHVKCDSLIQKSSFGRPGKFLRGIENFQGVIAGRGRASLWPPGWAAEGPPESFPGWGPITLVFLQCGMTYRKVIDAANWVVLVISPGAWVRGGMQYFFSIR